MRLGFSFCFRWGDSVCLILFAWMAEIFTNHCKNTAVEKSWQTPLKFSLPFLITVILKFKRDFFFCMCFLQKAEKQMEIKLIVNKAKQEN